MRKSRLLLAMLCLTLFCGSLTACSSLAHQIVRTDYIKQDIPAPPAVPDFYPVQFQGSGALYCVDEGSAKNLLKNFDLMREYEDEMLGIITDLREAK